MSKNEIAQHNIKLLFEFLQQAVDNPKMLDKIPSGSRLEFVEQDRPVMLTSKGEKVTYVKVKNQFAPITEKSKRRKLKKAS